MKQKSLNKQKSGFTVAELLVVVAIIGVLVAISIPIFTFQRQKAIIAVNKANIRSAKAAAAAAMYDNESTLDKASSAVEANVTYFIYDVKKGIIEQSIPTETWNPTCTYNGEKMGINEMGRRLMREAEAYHICDKVIVFVGNKIDSGYLLQTAPYYTEDDKVGFERNNPFGPGAGKGYAS